MNPDIDRHDAQAQFDRFVFQMDDRIEALQTFAAAFDLDLGIDSLERLEAFFSAHRDAPPDGLDETDLIVLCGRYLGEVVRTNFGGAWTLPLDDPHDVYFNQPVIAGHVAGDHVFAPLAVMRGFARRRRAGMLRVAVAAQTASPATRS